MSQRSEGLRMRAWCRDHQSFTHSYELCAILLNLSACSYSLFKRILQVHPFIFKKLYFLVYSCLGMNVLVFIFILTKHAIYRLTSIVWTALILAEEQSLLLAVA